MLLIGAENSVELVDAVETFVFVGFAFETTGLEIGWLLAIVVVVVDVGVDVVGAVEGPN